MAAAPVQRAVRLHRRRLTEGADPTQHILLSVGTEEIRAHSLVHHLVFTEITYNVKLLIKRGVQWAATLHTDSNACLCPTFHQFLWYMPRNVISIIFQVKFNSDQCSTF